MAYEPGQSTRVFKVHKSGQYELHSAGERKAVWNVFVIEDDRIGFTHASDGALEAVAERQQLGLPEGAYEWRYVPEPAIPAREPRKAENVAETILLTLCGATISALPQAALEWAVEASRTSGRSH